MTLQRWTQEKGGTHEWGPEISILWEDTCGTIRLSEGGSLNLPAPDPHTRHGLHTDLVFHSWKHQHAVTLHPLDHNPQRRTPEDHAATTITIQQDRESLAGYHLTWTEPAPQPATWLTLHNVSAPTVQAFKKRRPHSDPRTRCPKHRPHQPHRKAPTRSSAHI